MSRSRKFSYNPDDMPSKMHKVFAALEAYGCNNLDELLTLIQPDAEPEIVDTMPFDVLADHIIDVLRGQAEVLRSEGQRRAIEYMARAERVEFILNEGPSGPPEDPFISVR